jgi:hypothetical protein
MTQRYTDRSRKEALQDRVIRGGAFQLTSDQVSALGELMGMLAAAECDADYHRRIVEVARDGSDVGEEVRRVESILGGRVRQRSVLLDG